MINPTYQIESGGYFGSDRAELREKCLNCEKPECDNCLYQSKLERLVCAYDPKTGELVKTYKTVKEAAEKEYIKTQAIYNSIHNRSRTAGGYKWRWKNNDR